MFTICEPLCLYFQCLKMVVSEMVLLHTKNYFLFRDGHELVSAKWLLLSEKPNN